MGVRALDNCASCGKLCPESPCALCREWPSIDCSNCHKDFCECGKHYRRIDELKRRQRTLNSFAKYLTSFVEVRPGIYRDSNDKTITFTSKGRWTVGGKKGTTAGRFGAALRKYHGLPPLLRKPSNPASGKQLEYIRGLLQMAQEAGLPGVTIADAEIEYMSKTKASALIDKLKGLVYRNKFVREWE